jgi:uncharacterized membrane protein YqhA
MRHDKVTVARPHKLDWKAAGYLVSIVSVLFLGAVAAAKENPPGWYYPVLAAGMLTSIAGMACRYMAHLHQKHEMRKVKSRANRG